MNGHFSPWKVVMFQKFQTEDNPLQIKYSKTNIPIPIWRGVQLHSLYDPMKEAENLIATAFEPLRDKKFFLIFGLGFGYHVDALIKKLNDEGIPANVMVIEPQEEIYRKYSESADASRFKVIAGRSITELYQDQNFIDFLCQKPGIIRHPASFNLHVGYFKQLLSHKPNNSVSEFRTICDLKNNNDLDILLQGLAPETHFLEIAKYDILEKDFFLVGMLNAINSTVKVSQS